MRGIRGVLFKLKAAKTKIYNLVVVCCAWLDLAWLDQVVSSYGG